MPQLHVFDEGLANKVRNKKGPPMLPTQVASSLSAQWPCREVQTRQLASLLSVSYENEGNSPKRVTDPIRLKIASHS
jgi:hypothetical protein